MLSISLFDLIPESFQILLLTYKPILGLFIAILAFILGNVSIRVINGKISHKNSSGLYRVGVLSLISLIIHNLPEGIAVFMSTYTNFNLGLKLCIAIMMHNIPEDCIYYVSQ